MKKTTYETDWTNINLNSAERFLDIIDNLSFDDFLLEIDCNIKDINEKTVREEFEVELQNRIRSAKKVFEYNLENIIKYAQNHRKEN